MTTDYAEAIYAELRKRGSVGDEIRFNMMGWLRDQPGIPDDRRAAYARRRAMRALSGRVERVNDRGPYVRILA